MREVDALTDSDTGVWQVKTEASSYIIDLDNYRFMRNPGDGLGPHPEVGGEVEVRPLYGDSKWQTLASIGLCAVGISMVLNSPDNWVRSTLVRSITGVVNKEASECAGAPIKDEK